MLLPPTWENRMPPRAAAGQDNKTTKNGGKSQPAHYNIKQLFKKKIEL